MYKVFFNDRKVFLIDDFLNYFQNNDGLFYRYQNRLELLDLINFYNRLTKINALYLFHYNIEELRKSFRACFKNIDAAGGLVKNKNGEILIIKRRNKWDLPKGKVKKGESLHKASIREVSEECGIDNIEIVQPLISTYHTYLIEGRLVLKKTYWFEMLYTGNRAPTPQIKEDITEVKWFKKTKLDEVIKNTYQLILDIFRHEKLVGL